MSDFRAYDVEAHLRDALHDQAEQITPHDRLAEIRARTRHDIPPARAGGRAWFLSLAAAAAVAVVAVIAWVGAGPRVTPPATTGTGPGPSLTSSPSTSSAATDPSTTPTTSETASGSNAHTTVPVYFVGPVELVDGGLRWALYREFMPGDVTATSTPTQRVEVAVRLALNAQALSNSAGYLQPWSGTQLVSAELTATRITLTLSNGGPDGFDQELQRLAVQQLVWTAQGAAGQGRIPVTFRLADGATQLFGRFPARADYDRPNSGQVAEDVAPIWISDPGRDQRLVAAKPVMVKGVAMVNEATLQWELRRGQEVVDDGFTTTTAGAPAQGEYMIALGTLDAGDYTIVLWEESGKDGSRVHTNQTTFSVR